MEGSACCDLLLPRRSSILPFIDADARAAPDLGRRNNTHAGVPMIERSLLPSVPVGSGRHVMRLGHGGERAVGRATG